MNFDFENNFMDNDFTDDNDAVGQECTYEDNDSSQFNFFENIGNSIDNFFENIYDFFNGNDDSTDLLDSANDNDNNNEDGYYQDYDDTYENYQPVEHLDDSESIFGEPNEDMEHWEFQGDTNRCALFSQLFAIEELTGVDIDVEDFVDVAEDNGWFSEDRGTYLVDMNKMLDYYGVENDMKDGGSLDDIINCLDDNGKIIVAIDANEVWYGEDNDFYAPNSPNHAIEVIGIDNSDVDNPCVIVNDSGTPDGRGALIPVDTFMDAWEDSNYFMVEAY